MNARDMNDRIESFILSNNQCLSRHLSETHESFLEVPPALQSPRFSPQGPEIEVFLRPGVLGFVVYVMRLAGHVLGIFIFFHFYHFHLPAIFGAFSNIIGTSRRVFDGFFIA
jgi:hypothetical protein